MTENIKNLPDFVTDGRFNRRFSATRELSAAEQEALYIEFTAQIGKVKSAGVRITHADSHHYVHNAPFIAPVAESACREHGITKLRIMRNWGRISKDEKQKADRYRENLRFKGFLTTDYFGRISEADGVRLPCSIELLVHPDFDKNFRLIDRRGMEDGFPSGEEIPKIRE